MNSPAELAAVRHLAELGYEDPLDAATSRACVERERQVELAAAQAHLDAGSTADGIAALERLAQAAPEWAPPRQLLATACYQLGRLAAAREHLDWLEVHAIEHSQLSLMRAAIDLAQRRLDAAVDQAEYARHLIANAGGPGPLKRALANADLIVGDVRLRRGEMDAATEAFEQALAASPNDARALAGLAGVALRRGEDEAAVDFALRALEQGMHLAIAHYRLGVALVQMEQLPEARVAIETFARLSPERAAPYRWLAVICERLEDGVGAAEFRQRGRTIVGERRARRCA